MSRPISLFSIFFLLLIFFISPEIQAQKKKKKKKEVAEVPTLTYSESMYQAMTWRNVGPHRGGRSTAVAGLAHDPPCGTRPERSLMGSLNSSIT